MYIYTVATVLTMTTSLWLSRSCNIISSGAAQLSSITIVLVYAKYAIHSYFHLYLCFSLDYVRGHQYLSSSAASRLVVCPTSFLLVFI